MVPFCKKLSRFLNATSGLDLSLRLIHGCAIVFAELFKNESCAATWVILALQLALGILMLTFEDVTNAASLHISQPDDISASSVLLIASSSFLTSSNNDLRGPCSYHWS